MDILLAEGSRALFVVGLAKLRYFQDKILAAADIDLLNLLPKLEKKVRVDELFKYIEHYDPLVPVALITEMRSNILPTVIDEIQDQKKRKDSRPSSPRTPRNIAPVPTLIDNSNSLLVFRNEQKPLPADPLVSAEPGQASPSAPISSPSVKIRKSRATQLFGIDDLEMNINVRELLESPANSEDEPRSLCSSPRARASSCLSNHSDFSPSLYGMHAYLAQSPTPIRVNEDVNTM
jgi:hypothetical protein